MFSSFRLAEQASDESERVSSETRVPGWRRPMDEVDSSKFQGSSVGHRQPFAFSRLLLPVQ